MSSISNLPSSYVQSVLGAALQSAGLGSSTGSVAGATSLTVKPDNGQLSPFAQMISTLQQLQQSDPAKYQQVTQQIATNLQSAAQTAQADGNSTAANQLSRLSTDFANASKSGQLPSFQDLAHAVGGHHGHRHGHHAVAETATPSPSLDPLAIISNTLSTNSISTSSS